MCPWCDTRSLSRRRSTKIFASKLEKSSHVSRQFWGSSHLWWRWHTRRGYSHINVHTRKRIYKHTYEGKHIHTNVLTYERSFIQRCIHRNMHKNVYANIHRNVSTSRHKYRYECIYIDVCTYIRMYIYRQRHTQFPKKSVGRVASFQILFLDGFCHLWTKNVSSLETAFCVWQKLWKTLRQKTYIDAFVNLANNGFSGPLIIFALKTYRYIESFCKWLAPNIHIKMKCMCLWRSFV